MPREESPRWAQAKQEFPILGTQPIGYKESLGKGQGYLESWPPSETGTPATPRPPEFPLGTFGVENYHPRTRPIDIMGDVASHHLIYTDPMVKRSYEQFQESLTPEQHTRLNEQYQHARTTEGEVRPFAQWKEHTGLPGYFRGYAFNQWPDAFNQQAYTPEQRTRLDAMMNYLRQPRVPMAPSPGKKFSGR